MCCCEPGYCYMCEHPLPQHLYIRPFAILNSCVGQLVWSTHQVPILFTEADVFILHYFWARLSALWLSLRVATKLTAAITGSITHRLRNSSHWKTVGSNWSYGLGRDYRWKWIWLLRKHFVSVYGITWEILYIAIGLVILASLATVILPHNQIIDIFVCCLIFRNKFGDLFFLLYVTKFTRQPTCYSYSAAILKELHKLLG